MIQAQVTENSLASLDATKCNLLVHKVDIWLHNILVICITEEKELKHQLLTKFDLVALSNVLNRRLLLDIVSIQQTY